MTRSRLKEKHLNVITNQLWIENPANWTKLTERYSLWRYRLTKRQDDYRRFSKSDFFVRFTNNYKDQFDRPFYYFTHDRPTSSLYTVLKPGEQPKPWLFTFDKEEEILYEPVAWDELPSKIWIKLLLALCFHEASTNEQERRVCQSKFFVRAKGNEDWFTALDLKPSVEQMADRSLLRFDVSAGFFAKVKDKPNAWARDNKTYYEQLDSGELTYLRQLRPSKIEPFQKPLYKSTTKAGVKPGVAWYSNAQYEETRSYIIHRIQQRLTAFLQSYGFIVSTAFETMVRQQVRPVNLPLYQLPPVQVLDNRLNKTVPLQPYLDWLTTYDFPTSQGPKRLSVEAIDKETVDKSRPLLILQDVHKDAFARDKGTDEPVGLLACSGYTDPYPVLYSTLGDTVKQSLNVNMNALEGLTVAEHYLDYSFPRALAPYKSNQYKALSKEHRLEAKKRRQLDLKLEVSINELYLKWVISRHSADSSVTDSLPFLHQLAGKWGFMTDNVLLTLNDGSLQFTDLSTQEGKQVLADQFTDLGMIQQAFLERHPYIKSDKQEEALERGQFVLIGDAVIEIERTEVMAMPDYEVLLPIKESGSVAGSRSLPAISVYAGGIWFSPASGRYVVSGVNSTAGKEEHGHHLYQLHLYSEEARAYLTAMLSLLCVTFVRKNQYTVLPFPFDLIRLHRELNPASSLPV
ncbi:hypothetical protein GCM10023187_10350 [Nibrella viscosa]|uniref:Uncharacterized protein n=1 Tax=Nibrella viscosa TaxID=1084524 RepID=A0ABP8K170_9BACT